VTRSPLRARDVPLARALGAGIRKKRTAFGRTHRTVETDVVRAVEACREAARANNVQALTLAKRIKDRIPAVARDYSVLDTVSEYDPLHAAQHLAALFELPWVLGPLRALPGGEFEITLGDGWLPATEDLLRALDAESRLGAREKVVNIAVAALLERTATDEEEA